MSNLNPYTDVDADFVPLRQGAFRAKDYESYDDVLWRRVLERFEDEYNDGADAAIARVLVRIWSYGLSQLAFYVDRQAADTTLALARTLAAATRHTEQMGFKIPPAVSANGEFLCAFDPFQITVDATIPKGHRFSGPDGLEFEASEDVFVPADSSSIGVPVVEGRSLRRVFVSAGTEADPAVVEPLQEFEVPNILEQEYMAASPVRVAVDGVEWGKVDFFEFEDTDQYEVQFTSAPPLLRFGDGFAGALPSPVGATIELDYRATKGDKGNITAIREESTTTLASVDPFMVGGVAREMVVTCPAGMSGGEPPMELERVRVTAPKVEIEREVAVTQPDYREILNRFVDETYGAVAQGYAAANVASGHDSETIGYLQGILNDMIALVSASEFGLAQIQAESVTATASYDSLDAAVEAQTELVSDLHGFVTGVQTSGELVAGEVSASEVLIAAHVDAIADLEATIVGFPSPILGDLQAEINSMATFVSIDAAGELTTIQASATAVGPKAGEVDVVADAIEAASTEIGTQTALARTATTTMVTQAVELHAAIVAEQVVVAAAVGDWFRYLDGLFDFSCQSNVVLVRILQVNAAGWYTGAPTGLVLAAQEYLDEVKEVTQHVSVESGVSGLLYVDLQIRARYDNAFEASQVRSSIEARMVDLFKGREFAAPLYLSEPDDFTGIYDSLARINGLGYVNVEVTAVTLGADDGPVVDRLDVHGNVIPLELEVITMGTISIELSAA